MNKIKNGKYRKINRKIRKRSVGSVLNKLQKNNKKIKLIKRFNNLSLNKAQINKGFILKKKYKLVC